MSKFFKSNRGAKTSKEVVELLNTISFGALCNALHQLDDEAGVLDIYGEAISLVLKITPSQELQALASSVINTLEKKQQELSDLEAMFNAPTATNNNN